MFLLAPWCRIHASYVQSDVPYRPAKLDNVVPVSMYCALPDVTPLKTTAGTSCTVAAVGYVLLAPTTRKSPLAMDSGPIVWRLSHTSPIGSKSTASRSMSRPAVRMRCDTDAVGDGVAEYDVLTVADDVSDVDSDDVAVSEPVGVLLSDTMMVADGDDDWLGVCDGDIVLEAVSDGDPVDVTVGVGVCDGDAVGDAVAVGVGVGLYVK